VHSPFPQRIPAGPEQPLRGMTGDVLASLRVLLPRALLDPRDHSIETLDDTAFTDRALMPRARSSASNCDGVRTSRLPSDASVPETLPTPERVHRCFLVESQPLAQQVPPDATVRSPSPLTRVILAALPYRTAEFRLGRRASSGS
jgi:hypothetical protein